MADVGKLSLKEVRGLADTVAAVNGGREGPAN